MCFMALLIRVLPCAYEADTLSGYPLYYSTIQRNNRRLLVLLLKFRIEMNNSLSVCTFTIFDYKR